MSTEGKTVTHRILCVGEMWHGSDARSAFESLRRLGHAVLVLDEEQYVGTRWRSLGGRILRRGLAGWLVRELTEDATRCLRRFQPDLLFVFKGNWVQAELLRRTRLAGVASANFYPDVSFLAHTRHIPRALPLYDHVFTTKTFGVRDMQERLGLRQCSFVPPGFDLDLHRPITLNDADRRRYACDVSFIGTWSPKKEALLAAVRAALPGFHLRIWGCQWEKAREAALASCVQGTGVTGDEYVKAICGSTICLGLLSEVRQGASSGDAITARTFQIPACGTFMLHERTSEVVQYFVEGAEIACFGSSDELVTRLRHYSAHGDELRAMATAARRRSLESGYSLDDRMRVVSAWLSERLAASPGRAR